MVPQPTVPLSYLTDKSTTMAGNHGNHRQNLPNMANLQLNPRNDGVIYPKHLGYYMKKGLSTDPSRVNTEDYQLDKRLIQEINQTVGGYPFKETVKDYGIQHQHEMVLRNTEILENFVNEKKTGQREDEKLRIFVRGGPLCNFIAGNALRIPMTTLDFDYDDEEKIMRFVDSTTYTLAETVPYTIIGERRLIGDRQDHVQFGKNNIYRVMQLITDEYELYYSKEIDGFDGDEPIEIRGVRHNWGLNTRKILYRSAALADVKKIVPMIVNDENIIQTVSIIDDFTCFDRPPGTITKSFFVQLNTFFKEYIPTLKQFRKGKITKTSGGIIIEPTIEGLTEHERSNLCIAAEANMDRPLWNLLGFKTEKDSWILLKENRDFEKARNRKVFLCLNSPQTLEQFVRHLGVAPIVSCFIQHQDEKRDYSIGAIYWRKVIHSLRSDLLCPCRLQSSSVIALSPNLSGCLPFISNYIIANESYWSLSRKNLLFGDKRENVKKLLDNLSPQPELSSPIRMDVYTQEDCEGLLEGYFGSMITFQKPGQNEKVIFCTIHLIEGDFRASALRVLNAISGAKPPRGPPPTADLYLVAGRDFIREKYDNKRDLQLLGNLYKENKLDPIRKFPQTIALFTDGERDRVAGILANTHEPYNSAGAYPVIFKAIQ